MKEKTIQSIRAVFDTFESFGNLFISGPPWNKESAQFKKELRNSNQYNIWRRAVLMRDNYTCVKCGEDRRSMMEVDHIKPFSLYPDLRFAIDNGRTLCINCHKKTASYGGAIKKWKK